MFSEIKSTRPLLYCQHFVYVSLCIHSARRVSQCGVLNTVAGSLRYLKH